MITQDQLDKLANEYNKTKDPKLKTLWYKKDKRSLQMDLIILNDELYQLIPVTKEMMEHIALFGNLGLL